MKKLIGSKGFYKMVLAICIPIVIQNGFTNLASLLDNIMIAPRMVKGMKDDEISPIAEHFLCQEFLLPINYYKYLMSRFLELCQAQESLWHSFMERKIKKEWRIVLGSN